MLMSAAPLSQLRLDLGALLRCESCHVFYAAEDAEDGRCPSCESTRTSAATALLLPRHRGGAPGTVTADTAVRTAATTVGPRAPGSGGGIPQCCRGAEHALAATCELCDALLCPTHCYVHNHGDHLHVLCPAHHADRVAANRQQFCRCAGALLVLLLVCVTAWYLRESVS